MKTTLKGKDIFGTPSYAISQERKLGNLTDTVDGGYEMTEAAAKRVLAAKRKAKWDVIAAARASGCQVFGNGLVVKLKRTHYVRSATAGDVLTADESGMTGDKPVMYLILGMRERDLAIEESGGFSQTRTYAVKVTQASAQSAREKTMARRALRSAKIDYDAMVARSYDDGRVTPEDIEATRKALEEIKGKLIGGAR